MSLICTYCDESNKDSARYCNHCGRELPVPEPPKMIAPYDSPHGLWKITTEGDVEGRSTVDLGTYEGYIDDIARSLASQCYYSLRFTKVNSSLPEITKPCAEVNISLQIDSGTWGMKPNDRISAIRGLLKDRPVEVVDGTSYASVRLVFKNK